MADNTSGPLSTNGLSLTVTSVLDIIERVASVAELVAPGFKTLLEVVMSVFSTHDQQKITDAYKAKMNQSDADHLETQKELEQVVEKSATSDISGTDGSPKGGAL